METKNNSVIKERIIFELYSKLPIMVSIFIFILFFSWGIIDPILFKVAGDYSDHYGIFGFNSEFGCYFFWFAIGTVISVITYFIVKLISSYLILNTAYLKRISKIDNEATSLNADGEKETDVSE